RGVSIGHNTYIRLSSAGRIIPLEPAEAETVRFKYNGKMSCCSESLLPVLDLVNDGAKHAVREFSALATSSQHAATIIEFLNELAEAGVLITEPEQG
ncbi:MAG: hypothetical protein ACRD37_13145, partial [Candidatus Acidiferrales bacterium]